MLLTLPCAVPPPQPHRDSMSANSHPANGFIQSVFDGRLAEAIVNATAGTVGAAAGTSGGGAVAALTSHSAAALVGYAIGRRTATGDTGHTGDNNDAGLGAFHGSDRVAAAGQQQHYLKEAQGYDDDEALRTDRCAIALRQEDITWGGEMLPTIIICRMAETTKE